MIPAVSLLVLPHIYAAYLMSQLFSELQGCIVVLPFSGV